MKSAAEILRTYGLPPPPNGKERYYDVCPNCSYQRKPGHQKLKCLGVTITDEGVKFGCNHCSWTGGEFFNGKGDDPIVATYEYMDEGGRVLSRKVRTGKKNFWQQTPDGQGGWVNGTRGVRRVLYRLPELIETLALGRTVLIVEGEKDVETLRTLGVPATCNFDGAAEPGKKAKWRGEYSETLRDADIVIIPDHDAPGYAHADAIAAMSVGMAKSVRVLKLAEHWPDCLKGGDISDWLNAGHTREELDALIAKAQPWLPSQGETFSARSFAPWAITETLAVFERWLILRDFTPVYAVLGAVAANQLPGDPVWLGLIGPPSSAKTEILNSTLMLPNVVQAATLTPAGCLSGTPQKDHHKGARGGLLRQIGEYGIIVLKDFGSILSMRPDTKAETLAALREIYDGAWTRHVGTDGGRTLSWIGKVGLLFGSTGVIDTHYSVIGAMGDRFLLSRLTPISRGQFSRALEHKGAATKRMRIELAEAVAHLFAGKRPEPRPISEEEIKRLDGLVSLVVRLRGAVERDRNSREVEAVYGAEGTARIGLALERLLAGLDTLGVDRNVALSVVETVAMDSVPPLRRRAYEYLGNAKTLIGEYEAQKTSEVAAALDLPTNTVRRSLEDLAAYRLVTRKSEGEGKADLWVARSLEDTN